MLLTIRGGNETILIVEDEESILQTAKTILERAGFRVLVASTPQIALNLAKNNTSISVLLSNVILPGMNGKDLSSIITEQITYVKTVLMSGTQQMSSLIRPSYLTL